MNELMSGNRQLRKTFLGIDCILMCFISVMEAIYCFLVWKAGAIEQTLQEYALLFLALPIVLNVLVLVIAFCMEKYLKDHELLKDYVPLAALVIICTVTACIHYAFAAALCLFCIPVIMTSIFCDWKMKRIVMGCSVLGILIALAVRYYNDAGEIKILTFFPDAVLAFALLVIADLLVSLIFKQTEQQRQHAAQAAEEANEALHAKELAEKARKDSLVNMFQEIRKPVHAIIGMNERVLRETRENRIQKYAGNIQADSNTLLSLVNDMLDISRLESGKLQITEINYELSSLIYDSCNIIEKKNTNEKLDFDLLWDEKLPGGLRGDKVRIQQMIVNLFLNAVKYTEKGKVVLSLKGHQEGEEKFSLEISVKDTGAGIPAENLDKIFTWDQNVEGSSLGLAITKQLADLMQGEVRVESTVGQGTEFVVRIPQEIIDHTPIGNFESQYQEAARQHANYKRSFEAEHARILVIDDVEMNVKLFCALLADTKIQIDTAHSGKQGLELIKDKKYDIIFMDRIMPEMDGNSVIEEMKKQSGSLNASTPVIMMTVNAAFETAGKYQEAGFKDCVSKPFLIGQLEQMLMKYLPTEKVKKLAEKKEEEKRTKLQELAKKIPQLNEELGVSSCANDEELYLEVLQGFATNPALRQLGVLLKREQWINYQVGVHALKSTAETLGLPDLGKHAALLETAAYNSDTEYIYAHHEEVMKEYIQIAEIICGIVK